MNDRFCYGNPVMEPIILLAFALNAGFWGTKSSQNSHIPGISTFQKDIHCLAC